MATTIPQPQVPPSADDPFRYGWRYVKHVGPDGVARFEQVPLTREDVLHPQEEDFIVQSEEHLRRQNYLYDVACSQVAADPSAVVLADVRIAWDVPGLGAHGPDLAVILGVRERKKWSTFDVAIEGVRPDLIVELTSRETASIDRSDKLDEYDLAGVPYYVIIDAVTTRRQPTLRLLGYERGPMGYQVLVPDGRGRLWLPPIRVWLGIENDEIVCYNEHDQPLGDYRALALALEAEAEARAAAERRADELEARMREMEAELRRLREGNA
jgi:Uma2 family endonuclease